MGIELKKNSVAEAFARMAYEIDRQLEETVCHVGEVTVDYARNIPKTAGYEDQTGNLRNSTGYAASSEGQLLNQGFEASGKGTEDGSEGLRKGQETALKVVEDYPEGKAVRVVAGMPYAIHLESKGRDVLTSAQQVAANQMEIELTDLAKNIKAAFK